MDKITNPGKYNMELCPVCEGKGKLTGRPGGVPVVCTKCGGFGLVKKEKEVLEGGKDTQNPRES